jgi:hypothetical protein
MIKGWFFVLGIVLIGLLVWIVGNYTELGQVDSCLDNGGVWSYEQSKCEGARQ